MLNLADKLFKLTDYAVLRAISFLLAVFISIIVLFMPQVIAVDTASLDHGEASLLMWGICSGFIHGVGFIPRWWPWKLLFLPLIAWPILGYALFLSLSYFIGLA